MHGVEKIGALYLLDCCGVRPRAGARVCVCGRMLDTYKVFSSPYRSSFKLEFAMEKLTRDTMKCEIHVEITISQTHSNSRTRHKSITTLRLLFARKVQAL